MIVKVQLPLEQINYTGNSMALVYDESRKFQCFVPVTKDIVDAMDGDPKAFFHAHTEGEGKNKIVVIDKIAPWQKW